jgi:hypothetical protein
VLDPLHVPAVAPEEQLARYIVASGQVRADRTLRPEAFIPYSHVELSVTRHLAATHDELWQVGLEVAAERASSLHGRADTAALTYISEGLNVEAVPLPTNSNHADVVGWPADKPSQKIKALEIAKRATFVPTPTSPVASPSHRG